MMLDRGAGRLGARYTARGYLSSIQNWSLLRGREDGRLELDAYSRTLPRKWMASEFCRRFVEYCEPFGWNLETSSRRSALGEEVRLAISLPHVTRLRHFSQASESQAGDWDEMVLSCHIWDQHVRNSKARIDVLPSGLLISYHSLMRIYERSGGCRYDEFPALLSMMWHELLGNWYRLIRHDIYRQDPDSGIISFAVPALGGLALFVLENAIVNRFNPILGASFRLQRNGIAQVGKGSFNLADWFGAKEVEGIGDGQVVGVQVALMRTFIAFEDLSDEKRHTLLLLEEFLKRLPENTISVTEALRSEKDATGRRLIDLEDEIETQVLKNLRADICESLDWMPPRKSELFVILND